MKFDVVVGNPPYQKEGIGIMAHDEPVYHKFIDLSYEVSEKSILITPARFLFEIGQTPKLWNQKMLNDEHLKVVYYAENSSLIFPNTVIKGGVVITLRDKKRDFGAIKIFTIFDELNSVLKKVKNKDERSISSILFGRSSYKLTSLLYEEYPELKKLIKPGELKSVGSNIFEKLSTIFLDEPLNENCIRIYGRQNNERIYKWIKKEYVEEHENLYKFKVFLPKSNGTGILGEALSTPIVSEPSVGHTQTFISFGSFSNQDEAENLLKYLKTKFCRILLGIMKRTQDNATKEVWKYVPIQDFTKMSDIDWSKNISDIDQQLYKKYELNNEEIFFIEEKVREME